MEPLCSLQSPAPAWAGRKVALRALSAFLLLQLAWAAQGQASEQALASGHAWAGGARMAGASGSGGGRRHLLSARRLLRDIDFEADMGEGSRHACCTVLEHACGASEVLQQTAC